MSHQAGTGDRYIRLRRLRKRLDKTGSYWKHDGPDGTDGTWVFSDTTWWFGNNRRKSEIIDKPDPELKHTWSFGATEGKTFGGKRPSKRKSVK